MSRGFQTPPGAPECVPTPVDFLGCPRVVVLEHKTARSGHAAAPVAFASGSVGLSVSQMGLGNSQESEDRIFDLASSVGAGRQNFAAVFENLARPIPGPASLDGSCNIDKAQHQGARQPPMWPSNLTESRTKKKDRPPSGRRDRSLPGRRAEWGRTTRAISSSSGSATRRMHLTRTGARVSRLKHDRRGARSVRRKSSRLYAPLPASVCSSSRIWFT